MELQHCEYNYIPNVLTDFKEILAVEALVVPRPFLVIHGKEDPVLPIKGVQKAVEDLRKYYDLSKEIRLWRRVCIKTGIIFTVGRSNS
jgi:pimeloyl-ACP methyl ester carboxylesterase